MKKIILLFSLFFPLITFSNVEGLDTIRYDNCSEIEDGKDKFLHTGRSGNNFYYQKGEFLSKYKDQNYFRLADFSYTCYKGDKNKNGVIHKGKKLFEVETLKENSHVYPQSVFTNYGDIITIISPFEAGYDLTESDKKIEGVYINGKKLTKEKEKKYFEFREFYNMNYSYSRDYFDNLDKDKVDNILDRFLSMDISKETLDKLYKKLEEKIKFYGDKDKNLYLESTELKVYSVYLYVYYKLKMHEIKK